MKRDRGRTAGTERRASARLDKVFQVYVEGERGGAFGVARNISEGGMFVETRDPPPLGTQVRVTFTSGVDPRARAGSERALGCPEMTAVAEVRYVCHLIGRPSRDADRPAAVRGMGVRFLYFEVAGAAPPILH